MTSNSSTSVEGHGVSSTFETKDFNLAAFLWTIPGASLINCRKAKDERSSKSILYFEFDLPISEDERHQIILQFFNKNCTVEPTAFAASQSRLKDLIHSQRS